MLQEDKQKMIKEFDEIFVKDLGNNVEPVFKDPVGSVGPIKQFLDQALTKIAKQAIEAVEVGEVTCDSRYMNSFKEGINHIALQQKELKDKYLKNL